MKKNGKMLSKGLYYLLSFTWGLPLTLVGGLVALFLLIKGRRPSRFGWCLYFEVANDNWGGFNMGPIFLCERNPDWWTKKHEFGHSIQNCFWGPLMIFVITIPSAIRYWFRIIQEKFGKTNLPPYDSIWFEGQATKLGEEYNAEIIKY